MLTSEQVISIAKDVTDLEGYLLMNALEKELIRKFGRTILTQDDQNIATAAVFIACDDMDGLYSWYKSVFTSYMLGVGLDVSKANGINVLFAVWVHVANKILRRKKDEFDKERNRKGHGVDFGYPT